MIFPHFFLLSASLPPAQTTLRNREQNATNWNDCLPSAAAAVPERFLKRRKPKVTVSFLNVRCCQSAAYASFRHAGASHSPAFFCCMWWHLPRAAVSAWTAAGQRAPAERPGFHGEIFTFSPGQKACFSFNVDKCSSFGVPMPPSMNMNGHFYFSKYGDEFKPLNLLDWI